MKVIFEKVLNNIFQHTIISVNPSTNNFVISLFIDKIRTLFKDIVIDEVDNDVKNDRFSIRLSYGNDSLVLDCILRTVISYDVDKTTYMYRLTEDGEKTLHHLSHIIDKIEIRENE